MTRSRGLLLTLLQIPLVASFPHGGRSHDISKILSPELGVAFASPDISSLAVTLVLTSMTSSSASLDLPTTSASSATLPTSLSASVAIPLSESPSSSFASVVLQNTFTSVVPPPTVVIRSSSSIFAGVSTTPAILPSITVSTSSASSTETQLPWFPSPPQAKSSSVIVSVWPVVTDTIISASTASSQTILPAPHVESSSPLPPFLPSTSSFEAAVTHEVSHSPHVESTSIYIPGQIFTVSTTISIGAEITTQTKTRKSKSSVFPTTLTSIRQASTTTSTTTRTKSLKPTTIIIPPTSLTTPVVVSTKTERRKHKGKHSTSPLWLTSFSTYAPTTVISPPGPVSSGVISTSTKVTFITSTRSITHTSTTTIFPKSPALAPSHPNESFTSKAPVTLETTLTVSDVQTLTLTTTVVPAKSGTVQTGLNTHGQNTQQPFKTSVVPTHAPHMKPIRSGTNRIKSTKAMKPTAPLSGNIFVPIATGAPPPQITTNPNHPVPRLGIEKTGPIETNKFYANFFLSTRNASTWTHPYSVAWVMGLGATESWGISVLHVPRSETVFGPDSPPSFFTNPIGLQPIILSARELGGSTDLTMDSLQSFSCNVNLAPAAGAAPVLTFPLVQGMGFVTAVYNGGTPMLQSNIFFQTLTYGGKIGGGIARYSVTLFDNTTWLIYLSAARGSTVPTLTLVMSDQILGNMPFSGNIQVAKIPEGSSESDIQAIYDLSAGVYPVSATIQGSVKKSEGSYSLSWQKAGKVGKTLLMFALPHHVQSFASSFSSSLRPLKLDTTTKGTATAVYADSWNLFHNDLPFDMGFAPWSPKLGSQTELSTPAKQLIQQVAMSELSENFTEQTDLDSMYFSGKGLAKFAAAIYATNDLAKDTGTASAGLLKLKDSFALFVNNQQIFPLLYDSAWGGVVSSCSYTTGDDGCDFGNSFYNDHHFHYGYFVYSAAVIGFLDPTWLQEGTNKDWVNTLVRDYANSVSDDGYFPFQRMFDWYHGHSWAHGLFETFDGKDQESSSEDTFALYAIKMWGRVIGDANMEARGNLMLAVQASSLQHYYLMEDNNRVQPPNYIANKAAGIVFENKIDHTTYFGTEIQFIEGIHMIPVAPASTLTRKPGFVSQEWTTYFSDGRANTGDGWQGILYANLAIIDPVTAWNFFAQSDFNPALLDGGASRTWYLAWCAGLGGAPSS